MSLSPLHDGKVNSVPNPVLNPIPNLSPTPNAYDLTPYIDLSYVSTHPDRLAMMARLLGRRPAPVEKCRVLEVGCAAGGNLLPMAYQLPGAEFVGIDYSARQIEDGIQRIAALGLTNVQLICADLAELVDPAESSAGDGSDGELGSFDYIIAHGVYSWTPPLVRDALLALCRRVLRPHGVAYISYNTYPGWHTLGLVRDAMMYYSQDATAPEEKADQGRAMAAFLAEHATDGLHKEIFRNYVNLLQDGLKGTNNSFLLHDELSEVNDPVYFHQFVEHAAQHHLQYLVEVDLRTVLPSAFKAETQGALQKMAVNTIDLEQQMDFLRNRMFRQTLVCHAETPVQRQILPQPVMNGWLRSQAQRVAAPATPLPAGVVQFVGKDDATLTTDHPLTVAAFEILAQVWPRALHFGEVVEAARRAVESPVGPSDEMVLAATLLRAYGQSLQLVDVHTFLPKFVTTVSARPIASPIARYEAEKRTIVTNMWHERVTLLPVQQTILRALNGTHTVAEIALLLGSAIAPAEVDEHLRWFAFAALLVR
jgi:SAM-dependent methyltransferase/methyltransferase-like protein